MGNDEFAEVLHPSGQQWLLRKGSQRATVVEVGGGLRDFTIAGDPVLDGYDVDVMCSGARGTTLAPWPNRLRDGKYRFDDADQQLALSEPKTHNAIHGLVRWRQWTLVEWTDDEVAAEVLLLPQPGYPYMLRLRNQFRLDDDGLTVTTTATNVGDDRLPYGLGFHPYLTVGSTLVDEDLLTVPAATWIEVDERGLPNGTHPVEGTAYDFRRARLLGDQVVDTAYTDVMRDEDGMARVRLATADGRREVALWADGSFPYFQVFTGDTLPADVRRRGLGVEPMTCAPDAFNSGAGLIVLEPGQQLVSQWGLTTSGYGAG